MTEDDDPIFHFDALMGRILDGLTGIGIFIIILAIGYFWG